MNNTMSADTILATLSPVAQNIIHDYFKNKFYSENKGSDKPEINDVMTTTATTVEITQDAPLTVKRSPGRPRLTDEQKAERLQKTNTTPIETKAITASDVIREAYNQNPSQPVAEVIAKVKQITGTECSAPLVYAVRAKEDKKNQTG